jgi:hypothetical protein
MVVMAAFVMTLERCWHWRKGNGMKWGGDATVWQCYIKSIAK